MPKRPKYFKPTYPGPTRSPAKKESDAFYSSARWRAVRELVLMRNPLCIDCERRGLLVEADTVHHKLERHDRPDLELDLDNLEGRCRSCHSKLHKAGGW
jgi:5-methylcytosine-specific restriction enzyme A